jgi:beta-mannosidase
MTDIHMQYWFDVSDILASCDEADRVLSVNFGSAPMIADRIVSSSSNYSTNIPSGVHSCYLA